MDIINVLQAYVQELADKANKEPDYHKASKISFLIDEAQNLIAKITDFENNEL